MRVVDGCCCGLSHRMSDASWRKYREVTRGKPDDVPVGNVYGCWRVPRIYIACHGLKADELAVLAARFGWPEVKS